MFYSEWQNSAVLELMCLQNNDKQDNKYMATPIAVNQHQSSQMILVITM